MGRCVVRGFAVAKSHIWRLRENKSLVLSAHHVVVARAARPTRFVYPVESCDGDTNSGRMGIIAGGGDMGGRQHNVNNVCIVRIYTHVGFVSMK